MIHTDELNAVQHTLKIAILDPIGNGKAWDYQAYREILRAMPKALPWARWKYIKIPFGLFHPVWVDDANFDIDYHIRRVACPRPGDNRALCELISELYTIPMDHRRPLWMVYVVEGLAGGKVASVLMFHHAYADGGGASIMMQRCFKSKPFKLALSSPAWSPQPTPSTSQLVLFALREAPRTIISTVPKVIKGILQSRKLKNEYVAKGKPMAPSPFRGVPDSPSNDVLSGCRTFVFDTWDLDRIRRISKHHGVTINDLYVACAASAYRWFLTEKGFNPDAGPLVATIGFSRRPDPLVDDGLGNYTTVDYLSLPVNILDPYQRLLAAQQAGNLMKEHYREAKGADFNSILDIMPGSVIRALSRRITKMRGKGGIMGNAAISNVPGPKHRLYMGDIPLDNWISTGQVVQGLVINTTAWSYNGQFNFCILADKKVLPDGWLMLEQFNLALIEYEKLTLRVLATSEQVTTTDKTVGE